MTYAVAAFYRFLPIADCAATKARLLPVFTQFGLCGSLLIAPEGINGTLAGSPDAVEQLTTLLNAEFQLPRHSIKLSSADRKPFQRLKIRLKKEIITFRQPQANPAERVGTYIKPQDWNTLISDPDVVVLDTRNTYETMIGTFNKALDPKIDSFTDFANYVWAELDPSQHKKIAMFCTGGIRCEKASSFMLAEGFEEVYHLEGGILKYLEEVPATESQWQGECYVFDRRVSVGHGLLTGKHDMCFSCGIPLTATDKAQSQYEAGVSCHACYDGTSSEDKNRFRMRQSQLAAG